MSKAADGRRSPAARGVRAPLLPHETVRQPAYASREGGRPVTSHPQSERQMPASVGDLGQGARSASARPPPTKVVVRKAAASAGDSWPTERRWSLSKPLSILRLATITMLPPVPGISARISPAGPGGIVVHAARIEQQLPVGEAVGQLVGGLQRQGGPACSGRPGHSHHHRQPSPTGLPSQPGQPCQLRLAASDHDARGKARSPARAGRAFRPIRATPAAAPAPRRPAPVRPRARRTVRRWEPPAVPAPDRRSLGHSPRTPPPTPLWSVRHPASPSGLRLLLLPPGVSR